jgi:hypothetical protein
MREKFSSILCARQRILLIIHFYMGKNKKKKNLKSKDKIVLSL